MRSTYLYLRGTCTCEIAIIYHPLYLKQSIDGVVMDSPGRHLNRGEDDDNIGGRCREDGAISGPQGPSKRVDTGGTEGEPYYFVNQHRKGSQGGDRRR